MSNKTASPAELRAMIGKPLEPSRWVLIDQDRVNAFGEVTEDRQYIHLDPERAAAGPYGGTVAHGLLTLSLLSTLMQEAVPVPENFAAGVNYGYNKVRFITPVKVGRRIRAHFTILEFTEPKPQRYQQITSVTVEIEGEAKPALVAEWVTMGFYKTEMTAGEEA